MLPSFFIAGAMKSGTSTLFSVLESHPDIFMPKQKELFFFDRDDFSAHHADFFVEAPEQWEAFEWRKQKEHLLCNYENFFSSALPSQLCGEASTTYMVSRKAPRRIMESIPDAKIIFMLRDPVTRAYSAYWHLVRTGRAIYPFEKQIQFSPLVILNRGLYKEQIENYLKCFPKEQFYFCVFERFVKNVKLESEKICRFLGVDPEKLDYSSMGRHSNKARIPRFLGLQLILNIVDIMIGTSIISSSLDIMPHTKPNLVARGIGWLKRKNIVSRPYPPMKQKIRVCLREFYRRENKDLDKIIGPDVLEYWPCMREE